MNTRVAILLLVGMLMTFHAHAEENWNSYFVNVNDELASIFLDLNFIGKAPDENYPKLSWYWIKMKSPKENGLSSQTEFNALIKHEDELLNFLSNAPIKYVGRITTQGRREFYFYSKESFDFDRAISEFVGERAPFKFQSGQKNDRNWNQYLNLLYPSENGLEQIRKNK